MTTVPVPPSEAHPDDIAVDQFAEILKAKLARSRSKGRGGWQNKDECTEQHLSQLLREHVDKGDPVDVAAFAMFLSMRGERIAPAAEGGPAAVS